MQQSTAPAATHGGAVEVRRRMAELRADCERQIGVLRERAAAASSSFRGAVLSARSLSYRTRSHREKLTELKDQLKDLEADLLEALTVKASKESKYEVTSESISSTTATNEQLKILVVDQRARRDDYAVVISSQLEAIEALEAKINEDAVGRKNIEEAIMWYNKFLGLQVVGGQGVKFIFNKIDLRSPDKEYSFCIKFGQDRYSLLQCDPHVKDSDELVKDLNRTNDLFKFVRIMREKFQAATIHVLPSPVVCPDSSCATVSSPPAMSAVTGNEGMTDQSHSRGRPRTRNVPTKRGALARSAASPASTASGVRRSPRFAGIR